MSLCCCVCGEWYPGAGIDRLAICPPCLTLNFPASPDAPPRPPQAPDVSARDALAAFVDSPQSPDAAPGGGDAAHDHGLGRRGGPAMLRRCVGVRHCRSLSLRWRVSSWAALWREDGIGRGVPHPQDVRVLAAIWEGRV